MAIKMQSAIPTRLVSAVPATPARGSSVGRRHWGIAVSGLLLWGAITFAAAGLGGLGSADAPVIYPSLARPWWAPPAWLFGPAWMVLYALMAVAAAMVWRERFRQPVGNALALFVVQLVANALWSWVFFEWLKGGWALAESVVLLALVAATAWQFWRVRPLAGALILPSVVWVVYATALNAVVWKWNPEWLG